MLRSQQPEFSNVATPTAKETGKCKILVDWQQDHEGTREQIRVGNLKSLPQVLFLQLAFDKNLLIHFYKLDSYILRGIIQVVNKDNESKIFPFYFMISYSISLH